MLNTISVIIERSSLTGDVPRLSDAAVHDDALVVAVLFEDGDLDDFPVMMN